ncbi:MAG: glycosyltransferase family 4 protein [Saprospiraceae bacterium]
MKKLFMVVNVDWFFLSHRLPIALEALKRGYDVTVLAIEEENRGNEIRNYGLKFIPLPGKRGGVNIITEMYLLKYLIQIYRKEKPDIVHHVAIKPVLYGSLAARLTKVPKIVNAISGFGSVFIDRASFSMGNYLIRKIYKYALNHPEMNIIVQNEDDYKLVSTFNRVKKDRIFIIKGSGVDLNKFSYTKAEPHKTQIILMASRMLFDKGVKEFVSAARKIKSKNQFDAEFILAGKLDIENKSGIPEDTLREWNYEGCIKWIGHQEDMVTLYKKSDIIVLPTSYKEGLPKTLIEACAIGRPIVTTDVPGCREVVKNGENGWLVEKGNVEELETAIIKLIKDEHMRESMGKKARAIAEREFSIEKVVRDTFAIYERN